MMRETALSLCCDGRSATCLSLRRGISSISMFHAPDFHSPAIGGEDDISNVSNGELGITSTRELYRRVGSPLPLPNLCALF
eukprot:scaffold285338_cov35-Attheya_sp.AAC.1